MADTPWTTRVPSSRMMRWGFTLAINLMLLIGVWQWGWPAGNVVLLFWIENVLLGVKTIVQLLSSRAPDSAQTKVPLTLFFIVHYGIFCSVHLGFVLVLAGMIGLQPTVLGLLVPVLLLVVRYAADLASNWFGTAAQDRFSPKQIMAWPYPRVVVLHMTVLLGMFLVSTSAFGGGIGGSFGPLGSWGQVDATKGVLVVLLMVCIKLVAELGIDTVGFKNVSVAID